MSMFLAAAVRHDTLLFAHRYSPKTPQTNEAENGLFAHTSDLFARRHALDEMPGSIASFKAVRSVSI